MPLFVLVSGLFAKGAYRDGKLNVNRIISFAVLGLAFQLALALVNGAALTPRRILAFTSAPWYLISMAAWYAMTPILARLGAARDGGIPRDRAVLGAIDLSSGLLAISRTMAFLPCFALGYYLRPAMVASLRARKGLWLAVGGGRPHSGRAGNRPGGLRLVLPHGLRRQPLRTWIHRGRRPKTHGARGWRRLLTRGPELVPMRRCRLTTLGRRTLQVYVLHRLIRAWLTFHTPLYDLPVMNDPVLGTAIALAMTAAVTALCAAPIFEAPFARVLGIRWTRD